MHSNRFPLDVDIEFGLREVLDSLDIRLIDINAARVFGSFSVLNVKIGSHDAVFARRERYALSAAIEVAQLNAVFAVELCHIVVGSLDLYKGFVGNLRQSCDYRTLDARWLYRQARPMI